MSALTPEEQRHIGNARIAAESDSWKRAGILELLAIIGRLSARVKELEANRDEGTTMIEHHRARIRELEAELAQRDTEPEPEPAADVPDVLAPRTYGGVGWGVWSLDECKVHASPTARQLAQHLTEALEAVRHSGRIIRSLDWSLDKEREALEQTKRELAAIHQQSSDAAEKLRELYEADLAQTRAELEKLREGVRRLGELADMRVTHLSLVRELRALIGGGG